MSARFVTSQRTPMAWGPIAAATFAAPSPLMSATTTLAPSAAYSCAMPSPNPLAAPVTMAILSLSLMLCS